MELFLLILGLLTLIAVSNVLSRIVPAVPVPLFQIALGALLALLPIGIELELEPELFFVLFVAPLLFNDGRRTPRDELWKLRGWILLLAVGLVFVTVFIGGYGIHWMLPSIPLSAAFALAAILSPTDAVAVGALSGRIKLPKGILHLLEGEALMNDASGLVAFKFAVAATVTGAFSLLNASWSFVVIALGGVLVGIVLSLAFIALRSFLRRLGIEDATMHMLIQILTPFVIYIIAEEIGVSGVLGVVAGGIFHAIAKDRLEPYATKLQIVSSSTWSVILFILNGLVFLILGLQIPHVTEIIWEDPKFDNAQAIGYVLIITFALYVLRFLWVYLFSTLEGIGTKKIRFKSAVLTTLSGVRGAVTLAGAFSIPLVLDDGSAFPERDLIIFLSAGVILVTLLTASIALPLISRKSDPGEEEDAHLSENEAQIRILEMAVRSLKDEINDDNRGVIMAVLGDYGQKLRQIRSNPGYKEHRAWKSAVRDKWMLAIRTEREEAARLLERGEISNETASRFDLILERTEAILANRGQAMVQSFRMASRRIWRIMSRSKERRWTEADISELRELRAKTSKAAVIKLQAAISNEDDKRACSAVIQHYQEGIRRASERLSPVEKSEEFQRDKREWERRAIQMEREALQTLYANGEVTLGMMNGLRFFISTMEAAVSEEDMQ
ncbi:Na+/H+ antiporter [Cohnella sp. AR92]|uniref:Na+/H+ antiporter n=1 Tax=Cohnella sp. AR92 TaxID=648716 RepID=UPI000F8CDCB2|nr:Na+/H+ antiporter [Cohnella sp. AR92]RUS49095.1 Na+/H+ antiporter [Cohnella sp. AR92]